MANKAAIKFMSQLEAAFCTYELSEERRSFYVEKLSKWKLTQSQWDASLDYITENYKEDDLPKLGYIYPVLKSQQAHAAAQYDMGWLYYYLNGYSYAVRLVRKDNVWVNAPMVSYDAHGNKTELQKNPFKSPKIPEGAYDVRWAFDKEQPPEENEMPTAEEKHNYIKEFEERIARLSKDKSIPDVPF